MHGMLRDKLPLNAMCSVKLKPSASSAVQEINEFLEFTRGSYEVTPNENEGWFPSSGPLG